MAVYAKNGDVVTRVVGGETLLIPITGKLADLRRIYALNPVGEFIWNELDGQRDIEDIAAEVPLQFEVSTNTAKQDCDRYITELLDAGLVREG